MILDFWQNRYVTAVYIKIEFFSFICSIIGKSLLAIFNPQKLRE